MPNETRSKNSWILDNWTRLTDEMIAERESQKECGERRTTTPCTRAPMSKEDKEPSIGVPFWRIEDWYKQ